VAWQATGLKPQPLSIVGVIDRASCYAPDAGYFAVYNGAAKANERLIMKLQS